jgi:GTP-binding protein
MRKQVGSIEFVGSFTADWPLLRVPEIAFAGRSNVGKSSALNCLLNSRKAARVSGRPGRTQAINLFRVGKVGAFADLPGYGYARVPDHVKDQWKVMIESYLGERKMLKLVVVLVDARRDAQELDRVLIEGLRTAGVPFVVVATKADKLKRSERAAHFNAIRSGFGLPAKQPIPFSSVTREGRAAVWDAIEAAARA